MKKMRKLVLLLVLAVTIAVVFTGCKPEEKASESEVTSTESGGEDVNKGVIRVATYGLYYPYTYMEDDNLLGFDIDIWEEIGRRLDKEIEWEITSFDGMFGMLDSGKVDSAACQISVTPKRKEKYEFAEIYAYNPYKICVAEDDDSIESLEDLFGKKIGCQATESKKEFLDKFDPEEKIERVIYSSDAYVKDIELGRVDATLYAVVAFEPMKEKSGYKVKLVGDNVFYEENGYPFAKSDENKELLEAVNKAIKDMHEDGTLTELSNKWFGLDITKKD